MLVAIIVGAYYATISLEIGCYHLAAASGRRIGRVILKILSFEIDFRDAPKPSVLCAFPRIAGVRWVLMIIPLLVLITSCGKVHNRAPVVHPVEQKGWEVSRHLVPSGTEVFSPDLLLTKTLAVEWPVNETTMSGWDPVGSFRKVEQGQDGLSLRAWGKQDRIRVDRECDLDAGALGAIEVIVAGVPPGGWIRLWWAGPEQPFTKGRSLKLGQREGLGHQVKTFQFLVGAESMWQGRITRIRVEAGVRPGGRLRLLGTRLLSMDLDPTQVAKAVDQSWIIGLGDEYRNAFLGIPGKVREIVIDARPGNRLSFGYGVPDGATSAAEFRITASTPDGEGPAKTIFEDRVIPGESGRTGEWHRGEVDLGVDKQGRLLLEFEVSGDADFEPIRGFPAWSNPELISWNERITLPNIVLVSVDTLRADHLSLYGYERRTSPKLDQWARSKAIVFETAVAPSPWTLPSHTSLLSGLDCLGHGVNHPVPVPDSLTMVAEILRQHGYFTAAVTGGSYLHPRYGLAQGFDVYTSIGGALVDELDRQLSWAEDWMREESSRQPFFLFFHTYAVHDPYRAYEPFFSQLTGGPPDPDLVNIHTRSSAARKKDGYLNRNRFVSQSRENGESEVSWDDMQIVRDYYDSGVAYMDEGLGRLLGALDDNTVVIVTSDHGEALGEHQLAGHTSLFDHDLLVPLLVSLPGGSRAGSRVAQQVQLIDIVPTLLDIIGIEPPGDLQGSSLIPLIEGRGETGRPALSYAALSNRGISLREPGGGGKKYIFQNVPWPGDVEGEALYDLSEDPSEQTPISVDSRTGRRFRQLARKELEERAPGLRIEFRNPGSEEVQLVVEGKQGLALPPSKVKTARHDVRWTSTGNNRIVCRLEGRQSSVIWIESLENSDGELDLWVMAPGDPATSAEAESPVTLGFHGLEDGQRRAVTVGDGTHMVTAEAFWLGSPRWSGSSPEGIDPELEEQLRALGYIQ